MTDKAQSNKPQCATCHRERTLEGMDVYDYSPIQVVTGNPVGWYSDGDTELCPECMTKMLSRQ